MTPERKEKCAPVRRTKEPLPGPVGAGLAALDRGDLS